MTDKQKKEEIKQVVTNLGNIEFTVEDELKFCKEVLKRKEQECEFWKKELDKTHLLMLKRQDELVKEILKNDQLKAENDDLKKSILQECPNCGEEYLNYKGAELYDENNQLKLALQEIKEIAENKLNWTADYKTYFKRDNKSIKQEGFKALAEILQKCEVIDAR